MGRLAFVTWSGGGNVAPVLVLGRRLRSAGHRVQVIGPPSLGERVFEAELDFVPRAVPDEWDPVSQAVSVRDLLDRHAPDAVVVDYMLPAALCGAEAYGQPTAALVHTLYGALFSDGYPNPMVFATSLEQVNQARAAVELEPLGRFGELLDRVDRVVVTCPAELDTAVPELPPNVRYVGAMLEGPDAGGTMWRGRFDDDRPLVVISLGTTPMDEAPLVQRILDALADEPVEVLALVGDHLRAEEFTPPSNAQVSGYIRHASIFPDARVVITHAGLGTVLSALRHSVPMLCLPLGREQPDNARAVERIGAGIVLSSDSDEQTIAAAVRALVTQPRYEIAAKQIASCFLSEDEASPADVEISDLLEAGARRPRPT